MAAITPSVRTGVEADDWKTVQYYGTSAANQADTMTTTAVAKHKVQKLASATATYSGSPTQAGVSVTIDSGLGAGYDSQLTPGTANAKHAVYIPDGDVMLLPGDAIVVSVPAGGSGQTVGIVVTVLEKAG